MARIRDRLMAAGGLFEIGTGSAGDRAGGTGGVRLVRNRKSYSKSLLNSDKRIYNFVNYAYYIGI